MHIAHTMATFVERLASFKVAHPASKKRASSAKSAKTLQWPHENPSPARVCLKDWVLDHVADLCVAS